MLETTKQTLAVFQKAVLDAKKGQNTFTQQFETLSRVLPSIPELPRETKVKLLKFLVAEPIFLEPLPPLRKTLATAILYCCSSDPKQPLTVLQLLLCVLKDKKQGPLTKCAAIESISLLYRRIGVQVASFVAETTNALVRAAKNEILIRKACLDALKEILEGVGPSANFIYFEILKGIRPLLSERSPDILLSIANCLLIMGQVFNENNFEMILDWSNKLMEDSDYQVRCAAAHCMAVSILSAFHFTVNNIGKTKVGKPPSDSLMSNLPWNLESTLANIQKKYPVSWNLEDCLNYFLSISTKSSQLGYFGDEPTNEFRVAVVQAEALFLLKLPVVTIDQQMASIVSSILLWIGSESSELSHHVACSSYLLRCFGRQLGEIGQRNMLQILSQVLQEQLAKESTTNDVQRRIILKEMTHLILHLGEGVSSLTDPLLAVLLPMLSSSASSLRLTAVMCLKAVAIALPDRHATILQECITKVHEALNLISSAVENEVRKHLPQLVGNSYAVAALISAFYRAKFGIPLGLYNQGLKLAIALFDLSNNSIVSSLARIECGWALFDALISLGPSLIEEHLHSLLVQLWKTSLSSSGPIPGLKPGVERTIVLQTRTKIAALSTLHSLILHCRSLALTKEMTTFITQWLKTVLSFVSVFPPGKTTAIISPTQVGNIDGATSDDSTSSEATNSVPPSAEVAQPLQPVTLDLIMQLKTLLARVYYLLPLDLYTGVSVILVKWIASEVIDGSATSLVDTMLDPNDTQLGSMAFIYLMEHKLLEPKIDLYLVEPQVLWRTSRWKANLTGDLSSKFLLLSGTQRDNLNFCDNRLLAEEGSSISSVRAVDATIQLLTRLMLIQSEKNRHQVVLHFSSWTRAAAVSRRLSVQTNALCAVLLILRQLLRKQQIWGQGQHSQTLLEFLQSFLGDPNSILRRLAGEALANLACIQGSALTERVVVSITHLLQNNPEEPLKKAGCGFVLGCIIRTAGGLKGSSQIPATVSMLHVLVKDPNPVVYTWALHSLCMIIEASGLSFASFAYPTLSLLFSLFLSKNLDLSAPALRSIGRVMNATIGVLGPELQVADQSMRLCDAISAELERSDNPMVQLEYIHYKQMIALFVPKSVNILESLPLLEITLKSNVIQLRKASLEWLRQLIQLDALSVYQYNFDEQLFAMIDKEIDIRIRKELKLLITTLIDLLGQKFPSRWVKLLRKIVLASVKTTRIELTSETRAGEDDEEANFTTSVSGNSEVFSSPSNDQPTALSSFNKSEETPQSSPRFSTRLFAAKCLRRLMKSTRDGHPAHFNLALARLEQEKVESQETPPDFLILHLSELVGTAFTTATGISEKLRTIGMQMLCDIIVNFHKSVDPDFDGHLLLENYYAQMATAIRSGFVFDASPPLIIAACVALGPFINDTNVKFDKVVVRKVLGLLTDRISNLHQLSYPSYGPHMTTLVQLHILILFAELHVKSLERVKSVAPDKDIVQQYLHQHLPTLRQFWICFLKEYAVLATQSKEVQKLYHGLFYSFSSIEYTRHLYQHAWPKVLLAVASLTDQVFTPNDLYPHFDTTPREEFNLLMGLCVISFSSTEAGSAELCLKACNYLVKASHITSIEFGLDTIQELLSVLLHLVPIGSVMIHNGVCEIVRQLIARIRQDSEYGKLLKFTDNFESRSMAEVLFNQLLGLILFPVFHHITTIRPLSKTTQELTFSEQIIDLLTNAIMTSATVPLIFDDTLQTRLVPGLLILYTKLIRTFSKHGHVEHPLLGVTLQSMKYLILNCSHTSRMEQVFHSTMLGLINDLHLIQPSFEENKDDFYGGFLALITILLNIQLPCPSHLSLKCIDLFQFGLKTSNSKVCMATLQAIRTLLQFSPDHQRYSEAQHYISLLGPAVVWLLRTSKDSSIITEAIKILVLSHTLSSEQHKPALLKVIVLSLIAILHQDESIHDIALQVLMRLASNYVNDFKVLLSTLAVTTRQTLENALRNHALQQSNLTTNSAHLKKPSASYNLDLSRYT